jgi:hypothetical protein
LLGDVDGQPRQQDHRDPLQALTTGQALGGVVGLDARCRQAEVRHDQAAARGDARA